MRASAVGNARRRGHGARHDSLASAARLVRAETSRAFPAGAPSLGGPIVTAGGLVFIAGTIIDPAIRAFDVETGKEIWKFDLPTSGAATPMTYQVRPGGKQYLVIAAGGHAKVTEEKQTDEVVAFTLP